MGQEYSNQALEALRINPDTIPTMIKITEKLPSLTTSDIITRIQSLQQNTTTKNLVYKKELNSSILILSFERIFFINMIDK